MDDELKITIEGRTGIGKTIIAVYLLSEIFKGMEGSIDQNCYDNIIRTMQEKDLNKLKESICTLKENNFSIVGFLQSRGINKVKVVEISKGDNNASV